MDSVGGEQVKGFPGGPAFLILDGQREPRAGRSAPTAPGAVRLPSSAHSFTAGLRKSLT